MFLVDVAHHVQHHSCGSLGALVVRSEVERVERRALGTDVTIGAADAEGEREPPHGADERALIDILRQDFEIRERVGWKFALRPYRRTGCEETQDQHDEAAHDLTSGGRGKLEQWCRLRRNG